MKINKKDLNVETMRGTGPGGQHRNRTDSACRITHIPTGISAYADERSQAHSRRSAMKDLENKLREITEKRAAVSKKERRDNKVKNPERAIRTYDYKKGLVYDHRTNLSASIKDVLFKGKIDLLWRK